ncbi:MAG: hypothetical protein IT376_06415 [Polyangiaceae bacterium]|nr:hypothetical protein [Polyangiaceae bacterium]
MTPLDQERLMAYVDGELSVGEVHAVEAWVARDPAAREYVATLREVDAAIEVLVQRHLDAAPDLGASILAHITRERLALAPLPVDGAPANDVEPPVPARLPAPRAWSAIVAAAVAAAAAFMVGRGHAPPPVERPAVAAVAPGAAAAIPGEPPAAAAGELEEPEAAASIEAVDFGDRAGAIFVLEGAESTPVVWLDDEPPPRARIREL